MTTKLVTCAHPDDNRRQPSVRRLRVVHVSQRDDVATGGAPRVAYEFVRRLPNHGVDARLVFLYGSEGYFGSALPDRTDYLRIENSHRLGQLLRFLQYLRRLRPDVVHFHDDLLWPQLLNLGPRPWKTVIHAHGGGAAAPQPWRTRALYAIQRHHADQVVCITKEAKASQGRNVGFRSEMLHVIYNGVDLSVFRPPSIIERIAARKQFGLADDAIVVGFVGRLHDTMKGCLDFPDLIDRLPKNFVGFVAGEGPDARRMRARCQQLKLKSRVTFAGLVENVVTAWQALDVFCLLSRHEPFGLTIAEAMACGVPVVAYHCPGGSGELLTNETGCVIYDRNLDVMVSEIQLAACHGGLWEERLEAGKRALELQHDWDNSTAELVRLYSTSAKKRMNGGAGDQFHSGGASTQT